MALINNDEARELLAELQRNAQFRRFVKHLTELRDRMVRASLHDPRTNDWTRGYVAAVDQFTMELAEGLTLPKDAKRHNTESTDVESEQPEAVETFY